MSAFPPPTYVVSIYNPNFFITTGGLTLGQANGLYLQKNISDTATALETFSGGIAVDSIQPITSFDTLQIGSSGNSGRIIISTINTGNNDTTPAIAIGTDTGTKMIKINNSTNSVHLSSIDVKSSSINNIANGTGDINIGDLQTSGAISIGCGGSRLSTGGSLGVINIGTSSGNNPYAINIGNVNTPLTSNGSFTSTGIINSNAGINFSYSAIPSFSATQLGNILVGSSVASGTNLSTTITTQLASVPLTIGVWIITAQPYSTASNVSFTGYTALRFNLSTTSGGFVSTIANLEYNSEAWAAPSQTIPTGVLTAIAKVTTATTYYLNMTAAFSSGTISTGTSLMSAVRIA